MASSDLTNTLNNSQSNDEVYEYVDENNNVIHYDLNRLTFCETVPEKVPQADADKPPMVNYRISIQDRRADGKLQDFLIRTEDCFTYGISESFDQKSGELNGYSLPLPMWNQDGATPSQKYFTDLLEKKILDKIKDHLISVRKTFKQPDLELRDLRKMKIFYRKKDDNGAVNADDPPTWYPKVIVSKKKNMKIITRFYLMDEKGNTCVDEDGKPIELDPIRLKEKWGRTRAVVKIESIYIRSEGCSVQMKIWEADYRPTEAALPRKVKVNKATATVVRSDETNPMNVLMLANQNNCSSIENSIVEESTSNTEHEASGGDITVTDNSSSLKSLTEEAPSTKKIVRKIVVKVPPKNLSNGAK